MVYCRAAAMILMIGILAGCPGRRAGDLGPEADPRLAMEQTRREFQRINPDVQVGLVTTVRSEVRRAVVAELPLDQLREGQVVNFIDAGRTPVVSGTITRITETSALVRYEEPAPGRRHPREGDLAVIVPDEPAPRR